MSTLIPTERVARPQTVLGRAASRIPTSGKIRAGIQVLTRKAAENPAACELYDQGVAAGCTFEQIASAITEAVPQLTHPLVPRNVPWFTVRSQDFPNPETARQILDAYAEDRGDGRHLYRFPVVFPSDQWPVVMPHELAAWGTHEKRYWSEYAADGRTRLCMQHAPVPRVGERAVRLFGGRKVMPRPDNGGVCDPEACAEYQRHQCNLSGRFLFFIPGIRSISAFELHTTSFYAMNAAIQKFETIAFMRGGRISGFFDRQGTTFWFTKRLMEVSHLDEQGQAVRVTQWIIDLEAPVDVAALLRESEDEAVLAQADVATQLLAGAVPADTGTPVVPPAPPAPASSESVPLPASAECAAARGASAGQAPDLAVVLALAQTYGIAPERFEAYAGRRWGAGWTLNPRGRRRVWDELERYRNDPAGYADKIDAELARAP